MHINTCTVHVLCNADDDQKAWNSCTGLHFQFLAPHYFSAWKQSTLYKLSCCYCCIFIYPYSCALIFEHRVVVSSLSLCVLCNRICRLRMWLKLYIHKNWVTNWRHLGDFVRPCPDLVSHQQALQHVNKEDVWTMLSLRFPDMPRFY